MIQRSATANISYLLSKFCSDNEYHFSFNKGMFNTKLLIYGLNKMAFEKRTRHNYS